MLKAKRSFLLLVFIAFFSAIYRSFLVFRQGFPPGADIGLHNSLIHSITQGGNSNFLWNYYHMGGGNSITFPGYHIFVSNVILFTGLPDYLAQAIVAILFSTLLVFVAFLITRKVMNESVALIVAFLIGVSYYDIDILLWSGYPNIITLMLIPLAFYLLLEKNRFPKIPRLTASSLISAAIFLTHSLSTFMYIAVILASVFIAFCFPNRVGISRKNVLEWLIPIFVGGLLVSPFLVQVAPVYLNLNSAVYTGGPANIQQVLLASRLLPLEYSLPFFAGFFLSFVIFKYVHKKIFQFPNVLVILWLIIPTVLTQSFAFGLYTDYQRFLYFASLPLLILIGTLIFLGGRLLTRSISWLSSVGRKLFQKRFSEGKILKYLNFHHPSKETTVTVFAIALMLIIFLQLPTVFVTPSAGLVMQSQQQVMNQPGYDAIQWIKQNTPANSVFVADALYGWWLGGFAQRPTVSAVDPIYITNSREFEPALLATRLLDTDYLVDNGLIQIKEDGGYTTNHNPEFLAKLSNSYYPFPFLNFNNSQTTITYRKSGQVNMVKLSELPVKEMHLENTSTFATISVMRGNELLNFTQKATVYQGVRFVNMIENISSDNPMVSFDNVSLTLQTRGNLVFENSASIGLVDPYVNVAGQLIFNETPSTVTQDSTSPLKIIYNLGAQSKTEFNFYVAVFEYPSLVLSSATKTGLNELFMNNTKSYADKVEEFPLDVFDYHQAIVNLNASYIAIRDYTQISRFAKDPMFSLLFVNREVDIFQIHKSDSASNLITNK